MPANFLTTIRENVPNWLLEFKEGDQFNRDHFFGSRIAYYPGAGFDGHPVKLFNSTGACHCFIFVDYGIERGSVEQQLVTPFGNFRGYSVLAKVEVPKNALTPHGWRPQFLPDNYRDQRYFANAKPFALLVILERLPEFTDEHGGKRIAILFMAADGIATYEALFCQNGMQSTPFAVKLQDHGYGGNYDRFGKGGHLDRVACHYKIFPSFLLVGDNTDPWAGFSIVPGTGTDIGGYNANHCSLYQQDT